MSPHIIKESDDTIVYEIDRFSDLAPSMLDGIHAKHKKEWSIFRPKQINYADIETLKNKSFDKYFMQFGFCISEIKSNIPKSDSDKFLKEGLTRDELLKLILKTYEIDFQSHWNEYLGQKVSNITINALKEYVNPENTIVLKNRLTNNPVGTLMTFPACSCLEESLEQIGWVWIDKNIEKKERVEIKNIMFQWLKDRNHKELQAGVHLYNVRSQKFFNRMGFEPTCVHIAKR